MVSGRKADRIMRIFLLVCSVCGIGGYSAMLMFANAMAGLGDGFPRGASSLFDYVLTGSGFVYFILTGAACVFGAANNKIRVAALVGHIAALPLLFLFMGIAFFPLGIGFIVYLFFSYHVIETLVHKGSVNKLDSDSMKVDE